MTSHPDARTTRAPTRLFLSVAALLGAGLLGAACGKPAAGAAPKAPPPREVEVLTLAPEKVRETGAYLGSLLSRESVTVLSQVGGYVRKIHVRPGQRVEVGAPLVDIDSREENAALDSAVAQAGSAQARLELARQTLKRTEALYDEGLVPTQELERARSDLTAAEAAARAAGAAVSQRQVMLQFHTLRAAVPGVVGEVFVRTGDYVNAGKQLTSIAQADVLEVSVAVPAARARALPPEAPLEIIDGAGNVLVETKVFYVSPEADPRTQLVDVKAVFANDVGLRPSELVRVRLVYGVYEALQVPALSVTRQSGQAFVFGVLDKDGKAVVERRPITLGPLGEAAYVVEKGLEAGDRIAVSSLQMLRDGAPVIPKPVATPEKANAADAKPDAAPAEAGAEPAKPDSKPGSPSAGG